MHICAGNLTIIGLDNGLSPARRQAIIWTNIRILLIGALGTNFSEILIEIATFSFKKMYLKVSSVKVRPFCLDLNLSIPFPPFLIVPGFTVSCFIVAIVVEHSCITWSCIVWQFTCICTEYYEWKIMKKQKSIFPINFVPCIMLKWWWSWEFILKHTCQVTLDISRSPIESQWGSWKNPG